MKRLIAAALLLAACSAPQQPRGETALPPQTTAATDQAGTRLEALVARGDESCTDDGAWCVNAGRVFTYGRDNTQRAASDTPDLEEHEVWPFAVRFGETALLGVIAYYSDMYSGGGAQERVLTLYQVNASSRAAAPVLSVPVAGAASIRACFDEGDARARREACSDEYTFSGTLALDPTNADGRPRLVFTTEAATYPGARSRMEDSTQAPPLQQSDLVWTRDERCSYRRVLSWSDGAGAFAPDQPLPECPDYFTQ